MKTFSVKDPTAVIARSLSPEGTAGAAAAAVSGIVTVRVPLGTSGGTGDAGLVSWINPESGTVWADVVGVHWTITGTGTIDVGVSSDGTGSSDGIINGGTMNNTGAITGGYQPNVAGTAGTVGVKQGWLLGPGGTGTNNSIVGKTAETASTARGFAIVRYSVVG